MGFSSGNLNSSGSQNSFFGSNSGANNTTASDNTFLGYAAGQANSVGNSNTFLGSSSGKNNTLGHNNTFIGSEAGQSNTTGSSNSFFGEQAGSFNTTGSYNTFIGRRTGISNMDGNQNTFIGFSAGSKNTAGLRNTFTGYSSGINTTGGNNSFYGAITGVSNTSGSSNSFYGPESGEANTSGSYNSFYGWLTGNANITGNYNSYFGMQAGRLSKGSRNTFLGYKAGVNIKKGDKNVILGQGAGPTNDNDSLSNKLYIDYEETNAPLIYGEFENDLIRINGDLDVSGNIDLSPSFDSTSLYLTNDLPTILNENFKLNNVAIGVEALRDITFGATNVVLGNGSGMSLRSANSNTLIGHQAGHHNEGSNNTMLGYLSGKNVNGAGNVFLGYTAGQQSAPTLLSNRLYISNGPLPLIYGEFNNDMVRVNGELQIESNKLNIRNIGGSDSGSGVIWSEAEEPVFGMVYNGTGNGDENRLHLREYLGSESNVMTYKGNGNIGIGVADPQENLDIQGNIRIRNVGSTASTNDIRIDALGNLTTSMSDIRLKENIGLIPDALDKISKLRGISFTWKSDPEAGIQNGIIAQDVLKVAPELVFEREGHLGVDYSEMIGLLVEAIKELKVENETLRSRIHNIENQ